MMSEISERKARYHDFKTNRKRLQRKKLTLGKTFGTRSTPSNSEPVFVPSGLSTSRPPKYAVGCNNTSFVTMATSPSTASLTNHLCLQPTQNAIHGQKICNNASSNNPVTQNSDEYHSSSPMTPSGDRHITSSPLKLYSTSDEDDEMNVDSPDSGFESATPSGSLGGDYFDENSSKSSDSFDELPKPSLSRTSSVNCEPIDENRLCLVPPPKVEPTPTKKEQRTTLCKWDNCREAFSTNREIHRHVETCHVNSDTKRFCCLWSGCKVFQKPTRNLSCLEQHVRVHTGVKRFQCWLDGCDASFSAQSGLARHVPSHFSEFNLPKARLPGNGERRYLVKRRRVKNKKKALANIHDCIDQRTVNTLLTSLVRHNQMTSSPITSQLLVSSGGVRRRTSDGRVWISTEATGLTWSQDRSHSDRLQQLFFAPPQARSRKFKKVTS